MTGYLQKYYTLPISKSTRLLLLTSYQDTSALTIPPDSVTGHPSVPANGSIDVGINVSRKFSTDEIDSIFILTDSRQQFMDSLVTGKQTARKIKTDQVQPDSLEMARVPYRLQYPVNEINTPYLFLQSLKTDYFCVPDTKPVVFFEDTDINGSPERTNFTEISETGPGEQLFPYQNKQNPDWLLLVLISLLIIIAWLKLFYNKFFDQTLQSVFNYQISAKVLRDQNIFSRRVALTLNLNFILTGGIFFFLVFNYFGYSLLSHNGIVKYLLLCGIIALLLMARYIITYITGIIFDRKDLFKEYLHQLLLIYKSLGIYLIPLVIGIAYINPDFKIYLIYSGLALFFLAYLLRFYKGLQIIINKDILIFYLILYLCILEFVPVLVVYRFLTGVL